LSSKNCVRLVQYFDLMWQDTIMRPALILDAITVSSQGEGIVLAYPASSRRVCFSFL